MNKCLRFATAAAALALAAGASAATLPTPPTKNVVLVHGAFADGSADFMSLSQVGLSVKAAGAPAGVPAWKTKPSFAIVATNDRAINPDLERSMYKRAGSTVTELASSHVAYISHPAEVAAVIERAAQ